MANKQKDNLAWFNILMMSLLSNSFNKLNELHNKLIKKDYINKIYKQNNQVEYIQFYWHKLMLNPNRIVYSENINEEDKWLIENFLDLNQHLKKSAEHYHEMAMKYQIKHCLYFLFKKNKSIFECFKNHYHQHNTVLLSNTLNPFASSNAFTNTRIIAGLIPSSATPTLNNYLNNNSIKEEQVDVLSEKNHDKIENLMFQKKPQNKKLSNDVVNGSQLFKLLNKQGEWENKEIFEIYDCFLKSLSEKQRFRVKNDDETSRLCDITFYEFECLILSFKDFKEKMNKVNWLLPSDVDIELYGNIGFQETNDFLEDMKQIKIDYNANLLMN